MGENTAIEWCDHTFNAWIGCLKVSPACDHCYAEAYAKRVGRDFATRSRTSEAYWRQPIKWNREARNVGVRRRVFCNSLADVFDNDKNTPELNEWREDLWNLIASTPDLDWLILTKRIGNAKDMLPWLPKTPMLEAKPWRNVWLGISVCNQAEAERDIPKLQDIAAAVRFLSIEPILGEIRTDRLERKATTPRNDDDWTFIDNCLTGFHAHMGGGWQGPKIDWVIVGGESGPKARDTDIRHIRGIVEQCKKHGTPVFVKQMGDRPVWSDSEQEADTSEPPHWGRLNFGRHGAEFVRWPAELRVREFPK